MIAVSAASRYTYGMEQHHILWVAKSYTMPESGVRSHSHPFCHMLYAVKGEAQFLCGNEKFSLREGQTVLVPRDVKHAYHNTTDAIFEYLELKFVPAHNFEEALSLTSPLLCKKKLAGDLFCQIVNDYEDAGHASEEAAAAYLNALLYILTEDERKQHSSSSRYIDITGFSALSVRIINYLEEHFAENFSLDSLAEDLDYNKTYLCKAFRDDTGSTILDTLNLIRIKRAAELLTYSDLGLSRVAEDCGFATVSHFTRVFRKYVGITPGQCRRAYPANLLFGPSAPATITGERPDRFMRSILAGKNY